MLLNIIKDNNCRVINLINNYEVDNIYFKRINNECLISTSFNGESYNLSKLNKVFINDLEIYLINERFYKYRSTDKILIYQNGNIQLDIDGYILCDYENKEIITKNVKVFDKDKNKIEKKYFEFGEVLYINNFKILLFKDFIVCNADENRVKLNKYFNNNYKSIIRNKDIDFIYKNVSLKNTTYKLNIKPIYLNFDNYDQSFFLSIGPQLTMAFSTLSVALITTYRNYIKGRELIDSLPILILPLAMIISALIWMPLQKIYSRNKALNNQNKNIEKYHNYLMNKIEDIKEYIDSYNQVVNNSFSFESINHFLKEGIYYKTDYKMLPICKSKDSFNIEINENIIEELDNNIYLPIHHFLKNLPVAYYLLDLDIYKDILFINYDDNNIQANITYLSYLFNNCYFVIFAKREWLEKNRWIKRIPNIYKDNRRLVYLDALIEENLMNNEDVIVFNIYAHNPLKGNKMITFDNKPNKCDILIDKKNEYIHDYLLNKDIKGDFNSFNDDILLKRNKENNKEKLSFIFNPITKENILNNWKNNHINDGLNIVISKKNNINLNLDENYDGPHGLIAGATGSGKTELLLSLLLNLAISYSPKDLKFIILDFKGGAIKQALSKGNWVLPHITASLTNLDNTLIHRYITLLSYECETRQKYFNELSKKINKPIMNIKAYRDSYSSKYDLPYFSDLLILVDEFAEMKDQFYDLFKQLICVSRIGRSLGIHLILSTQKVGGVINDEILTNTNFKLCLKVNEKFDSKEVIQSYDAYNLSRAGEFYLLTKHILKKGHAEYIHDQFEIPKVQIIDHQLNIIKESLINNNMTILDYLLYQIMNINHQVEDIWKQPLHNYLPEYDDYILVIDDFYNNKYIYVDSTYFKHRTFILYKNNEEKYKFLNKLLNKQKDNYLIDIYGELKYEDSIKDINSLKELMNIKTGNVYILDLNHLLSIDNSIKDIILKLFENNSLNIFVFINNFNSLPYKYYSFITHKIALANDNKDELSNFFQKRINTTINNGMGLIEIDNILEFIFYGA